jgi:hypothetical protein
MEAKPQLLVPLMSVWSAYMEYIYSRDIVIVIVKGFQFFKSNSTCILSVHKKNEVTFKITI